MSRNVCLFVCLFVICIHEHVYMYVWSALGVSHWVSLVNVFVFVCMCACLLVRLYVFM